MKRFLKFFWAEIALIGIATWLIIALSGCGGPTVAQVREKIDQAKQTVATLSDAAQKLQGVAEATKDPGMIEAAAAALAALQQAEAAIPALEEQLKNIPEGLPWWSLIVPHLVQYGPNLLLAIPGVGQIPGIGLLLQIAAERLANGGWKVAATKKQKLADAA